MSISVIVPVYNCEDYLLECLESIRKQTYTDFEVILVNDGSKDKSGEICSAICELDARFKKFDIENKGAIYARKFGFDKSNGEYICFVDSDDWLSDKYLEYLLRSLEEENADVAVCNYLSNNVPQKQWERAKLCGAQAIFQEYLDGKIYNRMWNKLYRRAIVEKTVFPIGRDNNEDSYWMPQVLSVCDTVIRIPDYLYHYRIRPGSLMQRKKSTKEVSDIVINLMGRLSVLFENHEAIDNRRLREEYINQLTEYIVLGRNLDAFHALDAMKIISNRFEEIICAEGGEAAELCAIVTNASSAKQLYQNYWWREYRKSTSMQDKIETFYRFFRFCYRRIKYCRD